jgi:hypothetical protein
VVNCGVDLGWFVSGIRQKIAREHVHEKDKRDVEQYQPPWSLQLLPRLSQDQLFQFRADRILACRHVPAYLQDIRFAAYLAVFDILLPHASGRIHTGFIPLATSCALKAGCHDR